MRCKLLLLVTLLKISTLKTESIDFTRKNGRMDMIFPLSDASKASDTVLQAAIKQSDSDSENEPLRKLLSLDNAGEYDAEENECKRKMALISKIVQNYRTFAEFLEDQFKSIEQLDDVQSRRFSNYLIKLLQRPGVWEAPIILIKDNQDSAEDRPFPLELGELQAVSKRSRYYRRYPWKRQNSRSYNNMDYDPYNPCNPTKHDVFQLLLALHDARQGNKSRFVNFCNRRRPASAVYTNIRFLGRRRK